MLVIAAETIFVEDIDLLAGQLVAGYEARPLEPLFRLCKASKRLRILMNDFRV